MLGLCAGSRRAREEQVCDSAQGPGVMGQDARVWA